MLPCEGLLTLLESTCAVQSTHYLTPNQMRLAIRRHSPSCEGINLVETEGSELSMSKDSLFYRQVRLSCFAAPPLKLRSNFLVRNNPLNICIARQRHLPRFRFTLRLNLNAITVCTTALFDLLASLLLLNFVW